MQEIITLSCTKCKRRNYASTRNKKQTKEKLELNKYCKFCKAHTKHKEEK